MRPRRGPVWVLLAGGATVMAVSGCLWKDNVNQLPQVVISGPTAVHIGETAEFTASFTNEEPGQMNYEWSRRPTCPKNLAEAQQAQQAPGVFERKTGPTITWRIEPSWPAADKAAYCTFVIASDDRGAQGFQKHAVALVDRKVVLTVPAQVTSGMPARYTAAFSDDAAAAARAQFFWGVSAAPAEPCEAARQSADENRLAAVVKTAEWETDAAPRRPYCVVVIAKDSFGELFRASQTISNIINGGPPASPRVILPKDAMVSPKEALVGIFTRVRVAAAEMGELGPSDVLEFEWSVKRPDGTPLPAPGCEGALPLNSEICFDIADGGAYKVDLVTKEAGQMRAGDMTIKVEDRPPCISLTELTEPKLPETGATTVLSLDGEERVLTVGQVVDDGDPQPSVGRASQGEFVWMIRTVKPGEEMTKPFALLPHATFNRYTLPAGAYRLGDQVEVRVEYRDRLIVGNPTARDLSHCNPTGLSCETRPDSKCYQRVGWKVLYL